LQLAKAFNLGQGRSASTAPIMAKQSRQSLPNEGPVTIQYDGRPIAGIYSARAGKITVTTLLGSKTMQTRGAGFTRAARALAQLLFAAKEGKA
jgi:hypothetical protein